MLQVLIGSFGCTCVVESYNLERISQRISELTTIITSLIAIVNTAKTIPEEEELLCSEVFGKVGVYEEETGFYISDHR